MLLVGKKLIIGCVRYDPQSDNPLRNMLRIPVLGSLVCVMGKHYFGPFPLSRLELQPLYIRGWHELLEEGRSGDDSHE
jgi:hypothetical protein